MRPEHRREPRMRSYLAGQTHRDPGKDARVKGTWIRDQTAGAGQQNGRQRCDIRAEVEQGRCHVRDLGRTQSSACARSPCSLCSTHERSIASAWDSADSRRCNGDFQIAGLRRRSESSTRQQDPLDPTHRNSDQCSPSLPHQRTFRPSPTKVNAAQNPADLQVLAECGE